MLKFKFNSSESYFCEKYAKDVRLETLNIVLKNMSMCFCSE